MCNGHFVTILPASLQIFSTIFTCLLGGFLGEYLGRKMVCCLSSPVFLASFICVALAPTSHLLFFGQILGGIALGLVSSSTGVTTFAQPSKFTT